MQVVEKDITAFHKLLSQVDIAPLGVPNIYIDKGCGYEADLSPDAFAAQLEKETIKIPGKEKEEIISTFCGYTTWQDIKNVLPAVDFKTKAEIGYIKEKFHGKF